MKRIAITTGVVFLTLGLIAIAWQLRAVVLVFIISLVISATLDGPIERFARMGMKRRWAILVVYLCAVLLMGLVLTFITIPVVSETNLLVVDLTQEYNNLRFNLSSLTGTQVNLVAAVMPSNEQITEGVESGAVQPVLRQAVGITQNLGVVAGQFLLAFVLSIYWSVDRTRFERLWLSLLAPAQRARTRVIIQTLTATVGAYIRSELFQTFLTGALLTLGFWIIGLKYPFIAAMLAALAWLIPLVGGLIALIPVLLIGWMSGLVPLVLAGIFTLCVLGVMEFLVERRLYSGQRYWGVLLIFVMLALGSEFGLVGLLVAPPVAVALQILLDTLLAASPRAEIVEEDMPALRRRLAEIETEIATNDALQNPRLENLAGRIRTLLAESESL